MIISRKIILFLNSKSFSLKLLDWLRQQTGIDIWVKSSTVGYQISTKPVLYKGGRAYVLWSPGWPMFPSKCTWNGRAPLRSGFSYEPLVLILAERFSWISLSVGQPPVTPIHKSNAFHNRPGSHAQEHMFMTEEKSMLLKHEIQFRVSFNIRRWRLVVGMSSNGVLPQCTSITDVEVCEPMYNVSSLINVEFTDFYNLQSAFTGCSTARGQLLGSSASCAKSIEGEFPISVTPLTINHSEDMCWW